jgi:hypothetical protein
MALPDKAPILRARSQCFHLLAPLTPVLLMTVIQESVASPAVHAQDMPVSICSISSRDTASAAVAPYVSEVPAPGGRLLARVIVFDHAHHLVHVQPEVEGGQSVQASAESTWGLQCLKQKSVCHFCRGLFQDSHYIAISL